MTGASKLVLIAGLVAGLAQADLITPVSSSGALGTNDTVNWSQLGTDSTPIPQTFSATSVGARSISGAFATGKGDLVVAGTSWTPVTGAFNNGNSLVWSNNGNGGTGPVTFTFSAVTGIGAAIQADSTGQFTAELQLFAGSNALTPVTVTSDSAGDAIFIGGLNNTKDITKAIFSLTSAVSDTADLAIDTLDINAVAPVPEPGSVFLLAAGLLAIVALKLRRVAVVCLAGVFSLFAQESINLHGYTTVIPAKRPIGASTARGALITGSSSATPLPLWTYSATAAASLGGGTYSGQIIGLNPYNHGKTTTTIPTQIVPLVITINNGSGDSVTYDPTAVDSCISPASHTDVDVITGSPIFQNNSWTMNGIPIGTTQYIDAFQRAEFWSLVSGSGFHLMLQESTLAGQTLTFGSSGTSGIGTNTNMTTYGYCGHIGVVNINNMDAAVQALIKGPLASMINVGTFPIFLTKDVVMATSGDSLFSNCCVLGYHSAFYVGPNLQIYSPFSLDTSGAFGTSGYASTLAHEMAEAINDPSGGNPTPNWGAEGQVTSGNCQNNFEVGDPLSPGWGTPTSPYTLTGANGLSYSMQELAFFSWFYGGPSLGAGGKYSDHGTFSGYAKACPPGGTN